MKKMTNLLCMVIMMLCSLCVFACTDNSTGKVDVSFDSLKTIVAESQEISGWHGLNVKMVNDNGEELRNFQSAKIATRSSDEIVDFIDIRGNYKIYCDDNVRYYCNEARKYLDESHFDYSVYEQELLKDCLSEVEEFFKDDKNTNNLLNSSKLDKEDNIEYTFEIMLDKSSNKKLVATYICDKNNKLIMIKVSISSNNEDKIETEITENMAPINSPLWFDSTDYKTDLTYEQVKAIVGDEKLLNGWDSAEWFLPSNYGCPEDQIFVSSRSKNLTYTIAASTKEYFDGDNLYVYSHGVPSNPLLTEEEKSRFTFDYKCEEFKTFAYNYFFHNEPAYKNDYVAAKKYEKDITVVSYKFFGEPNGVVYESICSLIYDTQDKLIEIRCYVKQDAQDEASSFEMNLYMKKLDSVSTPDWFNASDFE